MTDRTIFVYYAAGWKVEERNAAGARVQFRTGIATRDFALTIAREVRNYGSTTRDQLPTCQIIEATPPPLVTESRSVNDGLGVFLKGAGPKGRGVSDPAQARALLEDVGKNGGRAVESAPAASPSSDDPWSPGGVLYEALNLGHRR